MEALKGKNICLITSGHIASNPRLVKEAKALSAQGARVTIVAVQTLELLVPFDLAIAARFPDWNCHFVKITSSSLKPRLRRYWSGLRQRIFRYVEGLGLCPGIYSFCRLYPEQLRVARQITADLYIAHNLAALPVAAHAAAVNQVNYAFDAEDFHRGESSNISTISKLIEQIEERYFFKLAYLTTASPLINEKYHQLYPQLSPVTINNVFSITQQPSKPESSFSPDFLKLFWFSQTLGMNRGIQDVLGSLKYLSDIPLQIGLLGHCDAQTKVYFQSFLESTNHQIHFFSQLTENDLIHLCAQYDIGLALEPAFSLNNNIALSNKLFTYLLAGNAIIASNTAAQKQFMDSHADVGFVYTIGDAEEVAKHIRYCWENPKLLIQMRKNAWLLANQQLNWEMEQKKWLPLVEAALSA